MEAVNLEDNLASLAEPWAPKVVGHVNDQYVKVAKIKGQLAWHKHDHEDELFLVVKGSVRIQLERGREIRLDTGEFFVVPKGTLHNPIADEECWIALVETVTTKHAGDVETPYEDNSAATL
jgi:quercetin dioxygenase-like cupin family protein